MASFFLRDFRNKNAKSSSESVVCTLVVCTWLGLLSV